MAPGAARPVAPVHHELLGGTVGGVLLAVFGHPLDTIKVKMQNHPDTHGRRGALGCMRAVVKAQGARGLFAGLSPPLVLNGALNAVLFATFGTAKQVVARVSGGDARCLPVAQVCAASLLSAPIYCAFVTPVDAIKVNLQSGTGARGPIDCARSLGLRGLFASYFPTLGTRFVGSPCYFGAYEMSKVALKRQNVENPSVVGLVSGFMAGVLFWSAMFPIDLVKSRVSVLAAVESPAAAGAHGTGTLSVVRGIWAREGARGFYRGFLPCVLRAGPANAIMFVGYEWTITFLAADAV